jgi:hypothetical protein
VVAICERGHSLEAALSMTMGQAQAILDGSELVEKRLRWLRMSREVREISTKVGYYNGR